jgi:hypothetical protein
MKISPENTILGEGYKLCCPDNLSEQTRNSQKAKYIKPKLPLESIAFW